MTQTTEAEGPQRFRREGHETIEVDHKFLRTVLGWLRSAKDEGSIGALMEDLDEYLVGHFEAEEKEDGFFDSVLLETPRHAHQIDELKAEHVTIKEMVAKVRGELNPPYGPASDALQAKVQAIAELLHRHERKEHAMLQDSLERDMAAGDLVVGGTLFAADSPLLRPWWIALVVSGLVLIATDLYSNKPYLRELRGVAIIFKLVTLTILVALDALDVWTLMALIALSSVVSHMPSKWRHRQVWTR
jgi:hypothetical protein